MNINKNLIKLINFQKNGDSILLPYEFLKKDYAVKRWSKKTYSQSLLTNIGVTSDDTDHLYLTLNALFNSKNENEFQKKLSKNLKIWLLTLPPGIGFTTLRAILKSYVLNLKNIGIKSLGNGPLMRAPAVTYLFKDDKIKRDVYLEKSTVLTHNDLSAVNVVQAYGNLLAYMLNKKTKPSDKHLKQLLLDVNNPTELYLKECNTFLNIFNYPLDIFLKHINSEKFVSGYIFPSFWMSIYAMLHSRNTEECFKLIVTASGDTDTIGAITASLISSLYEEPINNNLILDLNEHDLNNILLMYLKILMKNLISTPIILIHGICRIFRIPI